MKRAVLLDRLAQMTAESHLRFELRRHGGRHDLFVSGRASVAVPRHREVLERTAQTIIRDCERERGNRR